MLRQIRDPVSCLTHLVGAVLAIPCAITLVALGSQISTRHMLSFAVFGASLFLLYATSATYHMIKGPAKAIQRLRRVDHMMIFVLIAGTYTPVCLVALRGAWGWTLLALIWGFAISGIAVKMFWMNAPRRLSTALYVLMGWMVIIAFYPLMQAVSVSALALLICGGLTYTLGAVIYAVKWPAFQNPMFGFHELFHLFVMGGSALHVLFMFRLLA